MIVHTCFSVREDCKNLMESYGEICVQCNKCGRFGEEVEEEQEQNNEVTN